MKLNTLYRLAGVSIAGLTELGQTLSITHCTVQELTALLDNAVAKNNVYRNARKSKRDAFHDLREGRVPADLFIEKARDYLKAILGNSWNESWPLAGFNGPTLALPESDEDRLAALTGIKAYFTNNPDHESVKLKLTAALADGALGAFTAVVSGGRNCRIYQLSRREARDEANTALENKLNVLWTELETVLSLKDVRWLKFIDRVPGAPRVPEPVESIVAEAQPGGIIVLDWPEASRADHYKVYKQVVGVDAEPVLAATVNDSDAELTDLPPGARVKIQVVATNGAGDAAASAVIELQAA